MGGGVFQPRTVGYAGRASAGNKSLANLYDKSGEFRVRPDTTFAGYVGYAEGRALTSAIYPKGKDGVFGYLEVAYRF
jgi:hypothetical protein